MTTLQLDTHALHWATAEPHLLSQPAVQRIEAASELVVADITWWELAWLTQHGRVVLGVPALSWLRTLSGVVRTVGVTPAIAAAAAALPDSFPGDPADRLIYATAWEHGWQLVTKDRRLREHPAARPVTVW